MLAGTSDAYARFTPVLFAVASNTPRAIVITRARQPRFASMIGHHDYGKYLSIMHLASMLAWLLPLFASKIGLSSVYITRDRKFAD
jgi:hypothetical protein